MYKDICLIDTRKVVDSSHICIREMHLALASKSVSHFPRALATFRVVCSAVQDWPYSCCDAGRDGRSFVRPYSLILTTGSNSVTAFGTYLLV